MKCYIFRKTILFIIYKYKYIYIKLGFETIDVLMLK